MNVNLIPDQQNSLEISSLENDSEIGFSIKTIYDLLNKKDSNFIKYITILRRLDELIWSQNSSIDKLIQINPDDANLKLFIQCVDNILSSARHGEITRIKGLFPEAYIFFRLKLDYKQYNKLERECYVEIDAWSSKKSRSGGQGQIVDVSAWNFSRESGMTFECKSGVAIKDYQLDLLDEIKIRSNNKMNIFLASFAGKEIINNRISEIKMTNPQLKTAGLNIFGVEEMINL